MPLSDPESLPELRSVFEEGVQDALHHGLQVYVSRDGEPLIDAAWGEAAEGVPLTPDHRMLWLSSGKPLTAALACLLWERGLIHLDDPVAKHIPAFGVNKKERITIRHLLVHTAGIRHVQTHWQHDDWEEIIERINGAAIETGWNVGETAGYHVASSWFVLGEIARLKLDGQFPDILRREVLDPLGLDHTIPGDVPPDFDADTFSQLWRRERKKLELSPMSSAEVRSHPAPGANLWGPAHDLGRFYEGMLQAIAGQGGWMSSPVAEGMTARHRVGLFDQTLQHVVDYGLGVICNSAIYGAETVPYGFGEHASARSFGHGGAQSSLAYADPERNLVVVTIANGMCGEPRNHRRNLALMNAIEAELERSSF